MGEEGAAPQALPSMQGRGPQRGTFRRLWQHGCGANPEVCSTVTHTKVAQSGPMHARHTMSACCRATACRRTASSPRTMTSLRSRWVCLGRVGGWGLQTQCEQQPGDRVVATSSPGVGPPRHHARHHACLRAPRTLMQRWCKHSLAAMRPLPAAPLSASSQHRAGPDLPPCPPVDPPHRPATLRWRLPPTT